MTKGISPLIASVLLIAITIAVAAVLATWVTTYTEKSLPTTTCVGGSMAFVSAEYPKWSDGSIVACIEAQYVSLGDFQIEVLLNDDTVQRFNDITDTSIAPGATGCIRTEQLTFAKSDVKSIKILTNCTNVNLQSILK
ncbi:MAG: type IV pilin [Candidatus Aenigmarchaeota archaeon]|nr:type IV pilin [Candidatus Aenigmarchaeota archaeon]